MLNTMRMVLLVNHTCFYLGTNAVQECTCLTYQVMRNEYLVDNVLKTELVGTQGRTGLSCSFVSLFPMLPFLDYGANVHTWPLADSKVGTGPFQCCTCLDSHPHAEWLGQVGSRAKCLRMIYVWWPHSSLNYHWVILQKLALKPGANF